MLTRRDGLFFIHVFAFGVFAIFLISLPNASGQKLAEAPPAPAPGYSVAPAADHANAAPACANWRP